MPQIIPIKELKKTSEISKMCHEADGPIYITKNGKTVAKLTSPYQDRVKKVESLFGVLSKDLTLDEAREERADKI